MSETTAAVISPDYSLCSRMPSTLVSSSVNSRLIIDRFQAEGDNNLSSSPIIHRAGAGETGQRRQQSVSGQKHCTDDGSDCDTHQIRQEAFLTCGCDEKFASSASLSRLACHRKITPGWSGPE